MFRLFTNNDPQNDALNLNHSVNSLAHFLTSLTGNRLDFSRGFDFSRSINSAVDGTLHYANEEIIIRSTMLITTAVGGYLGHYLNTQNEDPMLSNTSATLAGTIAGLTIGHIPVVYSIVKKRLKMKEECKILIEGLNETAKKLDISSDLIKSITDSILICNLANGKTSNASLTLARINSVLRDLKEVLTNQEDQNTAEQFLNRLKEGKNIALVFKQEITLESIADKSSAINLCI